MHALNHTILRRERKKGEGIVRAHGKLSSRLHVLALDRGIPSERKTHTHFIHPPFFQGLLICRHSVTKKKLDYTAIIVTNANKQNGSIPSIIGPALRPFQCTV
jgi:hypothetical protein